MAEEIIRTVENVDRLFSEIVVNGESHVSENYVPPVQLGQQNVGNASPVEETQGEDVDGVKLNNILHNLKDQATAQDLTDEITARQNADGVLQQNINTVAGDLTTVSNDLDTAEGNITTLQTNVGTLQGNVSTIQGNVSTIQGKIPSQASSSNQLADKDFVNSSIATNTANFLGTYTSLADIEAIQNPTNNDYAFLQTTDSAGNNVFDRYKYNGEDDEWLFEYELNNSSFTAEQWATINSGLTSTSVSDAINALDASGVGGNGKYIKAISEANGVISATEETMDTVPTQNSTNACTSGGIYTAIQNASGGTIDTAMSDSSTNAVQNKVIKSYVDTNITNAITTVLNTYY